MAEKLTFLLCSKARYNEDLRELIEKLVLLTEVALLSSSDEKDRIDTAHTTAQIPRDEFYRKSQKPELMDLLDDWEEPQLAKKVLSVS